MKLLAVESATLSGGSPLDDDRLSAITLNIDQPSGASCRGGPSLADCGLAADLTVSPSLWGQAPSRGSALKATVRRCHGARPPGPRATLDASPRLPFADAPVCPILDARKGEVYLSLYRWSRSGMERQWDYLALPPESAAARLEAPVILLGDGIEACRPWLDDRLGEGARVAPAAQRLPSAAAVAVLGRAALVAGGGVSAEALAPLPPALGAELKSRQG
jgi:tRNA threonylcarbamoyladenosine biosynthesis protein TsaB